MSNPCEVTSEIIFIDKNNSFTLEYKLDGKLYDFSNTTKIVFTLNGKDVNSVSEPTWFDFSTGTDGRIIFKLGTAGYLKADSGYATICVFDTANPSGVIFSSKLRNQVLINVEP